MRKLFLGRLTFRTATLVLIEHVLIVFAVALAAVLRFDIGSVAAELTDGSLLWRASLIAAVLQIALHYCDLYDLRTLSDRRDLVVGLIRALGGASLMLAVLYYWIPAAHHRPRRVRHRLGVRDCPGRRMAAGL